MSSLLMALTKPSVTNEPPSDFEIRRNDLALLITVIFALFLGYGIRNNAVNASRTVELGADLPAVLLPARWITGEGEEYIASARNPSSPSIFDSEIKIAVRPLRPEENMVTARAGLSVQRTQELLRYRELSADAVTVGSEPGMLVTYAYIADPTRPAGALAAPVVVQAQDLVFVDPDSSQLIVVTTAADATDWDAEEHYFRIVHNSLDVRESAPAALPAETPAESSTELSTEEGEQ
jgi:hypothetical protein